MIHKHPNVIIPLVVSDFENTNIIMALVDAHLMKDDTVIYDTIDNLLQDIEDTPIHSNLPPKDYAHFLAVVEFYRHSVNRMLNGWIQDYYDNQLGVVDINFTATGTILIFEQFE